jgi:hypothetical protein
MLKLGIIRKLRQWRYTGITTASVIWLVARLYAGAVMSARFDFKYVHHYFKNNYDYNKIPVSNESLRLLRYIDEPYNPNETFNSSIGKNIQALKKKGNTITHEDGLHQVLFRSILGILDLKHSNEIPHHLQTAENIIAIKRMMPWVHIEKKYYVNLSLVESFVHLDWPPADHINATAVPKELTEYILQHAKKPSDWLDINTLTEDQQVEYLRTDSIFSANDGRFISTIKKGMLKYPMDFVARTTHMRPEFVAEIVDFCNKNRIKFSLGRNTEESRGIIAMLDRGLSPKLASEDEVNILKLSDFSVDRIKLSAVAAAKSSDQWNMHIRHLAKSFTEEDWLDLENLVERHPSTLNVLSFDVQNCSMVMTRFNQKKIPSYYFNLNHTGCREALPFLVREKPELIPLIISKNDGKENLIDAFLAEIATMVELPAFITELSTPELLHKACAQSCLYSRTKLKSIDIKEALACANTRQQFEFINRYLAPTTAERHVELYPTSMHDDLLMSDLGL